MILPVVELGVGNLRMILVVSSLGDGLCIGRYRCGKVPGC